MNWFIFIYSHKGYKQINFVKKYKMVVDVGVSLILKECWYFIDVCDYCKTHGKFEKL